MSDAPQNAPEAPEAPKPDEGAEKTFKQADIDKIIDGVVARERKKHADEMSALKADAEKGKTAEERIAALESEIQTTRRDAMRSRVQAAHGISDEDAALFLTGADEESLTAQAKRLAERDAERKKTNNVSPREGNNPASGESEERQFAQSLFSGD